MHDINKEIIDRAALGDSEAFEQIYRTLSGFVFNVSLRVVQRQEDAEEITQEVFLTIYRKLGSFRFASAFKTWVYRITINTAVNYAKKNLKGKNRMVEYTEDLKMAKPTNETEQSIDKEYQGKLINKLLNLLNPDQRACIVLRNIEGLSYQEIAQSLNININTVRSRLKRARENLLAQKEEVIKNAM